VILMIIKKVDSQHGKKYGTRPLHLWKVCENVRLTQAAQNCLPMSAFASIGGGGQRVLCSVQRAASNFGRVPEALYVRFAHLRGDHL
jgi:hypothetical protein